MAAHRLAPPLRLGLVLDGDALSVSPLDLVAIEGGVAENQHRGLVGHQLVADTEIADRVPGLREVEAPGIGQRLDLLDPAHRPEALELWVVGVDVGELEAGGVRLVLAREPRVQGHRGRSRTFVSTEEHQLLAAVDLAQHLSGVLEGPNAADFELGVVQRLVGDLALGQQDLTDHVVAVRHLRVEAAAGFGDQPHQRPVGAVPHQEAEEAHVVALHQLVEPGGVHHAGVGDGVGHQDHAGGAIGVQVVQRSGDASVEIGAATGLQRFHLANVPGHVLGRGGGPAAGQLPLPIVEGHDPEAIASVELAQCLADSVGQGLDLAGHAAGDVQHEGVVRTAGDGLEIQARRHHHHEGARRGRIGPVGDHLDAPGKPVLQAVVEDEVAVELRPRPLQVHLVAPLLDLGHGGLALEARHAHLGDGPGALQLEVDREEALDLGVGDPEALGDLVGAPLFEGIEIPPDTGVDLQRLVVDEAQARLVLGANWRDPELVGLVAVLGGEAGVVAPVALLPVDPLRLFLRGDLAVDLRLADEEGHLGEARASRYRKCVDALEVDRVRIEEGLGHFGLREAVVDHDLGVVLADLDGRVGRAHRCERSRRSRAARGEQDGEQGGTGSDSSTHAGVSSDRMGG